MTTARSSYFKLFAWCLTALLCGGTIDSAQCNDSDVLYEGWRTSGLTSDLYIRMLNDKRQWVSEDLMSASGIENGDKEYRRIGSVEQSRNNYSRIQQAQVKANKLRSKLNRVRLLVKKYPELRISEVWRIMTGVDALGSAARVNMLPLVYRDVLKDGDEKTPVLEKFHRYAFEQLQTRIDLYKGIEERKAGEGMRAFINEVREVLFFTETKFSLDEIKILAVAEETILKDTAAAGLSWPERMARTIKQISGKAELPLQDIVQLRSATSSDCAAVFSKIAQLI